jgi:preprotein translocase subunit SecF
LTLIKHFNTNKLILIILAVSILTLATGCSKAAKDQSQAPASTQGKASVNSSNSPSPSAAVKSQPDQDLTKKLTSEKFVQSGQVYLAGNDAVAVIMIKKGTDNKTTKDLTTKYAQTMKQKYSNKKINAHAFIEGKEIAHITL